MTRCRLESADGGKVVKKLKTFFGKGRYHLRWHWSGYYAK